MGCHVLHLEIPCPYYVPPSLVQSLIWKYKISFCVSDTRLLGWLTVMGEARPGARGWPELYGWEVVGAPGGRQWPRPIRARVRGGTPGRDWDATRTCYVTGSVINPLGTTGIRCQMSHPKVPSHHYGQLPTMVWCAECYTGKYHQPTRDNFPQWEWAPSVIPGNTISQPGTTAHSGMGRQVLYREISSPH